MSEKIEALAKRIASLDKHLKVIRTKWNLGIIGLYSAITFLVLRICDADSLTSILAWIGTVLASLFLGLVCYVINAVIWTNFCRSINETLDYKKKLEKEYNDLVMSEKRNSK